MLKKICICWAVITVCIFVYSHPAAALEARPPEANKEGRGNDEKPAVVKEKEAAVEKEKKAVAEKDKQAIAEKKAAAEKKLAAEKEKKAAVEKKAADEKQKKEAVEKEKKADAEKLAAAEKEARAAVERQKKAEAERDKFRFERKQLEKQLQAQKEQYKKELARQQVEKQRRELEEGFKDKAFLKMKQDGQRLQNELSALERVNKGLEEKTKELYIRNEDYKAAKDEVEKLGRMVTTLNKERLSLKEDNKALSNDITVLKDQMRNKEAAFYEQLGNAYYKAGELEQAIKNFGQCLEFNPDSARAHYMLGLLYKASRDDYSKAVHHLRMYLKLDPYSTDRRDVEYLIKMLISESKDEAK